jgi:hypothetical protein
MGGRLLLLGFVWGARELYRRKDLAESAEGLNPREEVVNAGMACKADDGRSARSAGPHVRGA